MTSKRFERKLKALKYGQWAQFKIDSMSCIKDLVFFLEDRQIRAMANADRSPLRPERKDADWYQTFQSYLSDIEECPFRVCPRLNDMSRADWIEVIEWLVGRAILLDYEDNKEKYNNNKPIRRVKKKNYNLSDCQTKECADALQALCNLLKVPPNEDILVTAESLHTLISTKFNNTAIVNYEASLEEAKDSQIEVQDVFDRVKTYKDIVRLYSHYEGFRTGDEKVDAAAIILKILYILDVRSMQNQLNEIVTFIQRFTANPRTNTKLGKVGY